MSASFDVNWMTSSFIIYAYLIMQIKAVNFRENLLQVFILDTILNYIPI